MKSDIHPKYTKMVASCRCGATIETRSTLGRDMNIEVCSNCHPFYTGKQKVLDTGGRVERFRKLFGRPSVAASTE